MAPKMVRRGNVWVLADAPSAPQSVDVDAIVQALREVLVLLTKDDPPEGVEDLSPETAQAWLEEYAALLRAEQETADSNGATPPGAPGSQASPSDAAVVVQALRNGIDRRRIEIAQDIAARRGIKLQDALNFVPR